MRIAPRWVAVTAALAAAPAARKSNRVRRLLPGGATQDRTRHSGCAKRRPMRARPYTLSFLIIDAHRNATNV
jgi:hypothetical protein